MDLIRGSLIQRETLFVSRIESCPIPEGALLARYCQAGAFADCYRADIPGKITQAEYVAAFYTTPLFKVERMILATVLSRPSTDAQATQLAEGALDTFAAWHVEARAADQLLMCDYQRRTRSWFMAAPMADERGAHTRLYFGSGVVPSRNPKTGTTSLGPLFRALLGFHKIYSRALLHSAQVRLEKVCVPPCA